VVAYSKKMGSHAKVTIDGTDVSNGFSSIQRDSVNATVPAGGFSVGGVAEQLLGERTQGFSGTAFVTEELSAICEPIHRNREIVEMTFQPDGLIDATREIYIGNVYISEWSPNSTFGDVSTMNFQAVAADATGINATDFT